MPFLRILNIPNATRTIGYADGSMQRAFFTAPIFQKLKDYEYNESLMQLHFMGGGARIVEAVGEYNRERTHFNHDICATVKGYEYYCYMILRHNKKYS